MELAASRTSMESIVMRTYQLTTLEKAITPSAICKAWDTLLELQCAKWDMPLVPQEKVKANELVKMDPFSGLYFAWDGLFVSYVGKSRNIPNRVRCHEKFSRYDTLISFIVMPEDDIGLAEIFYIWLLRPELNSETWSA